MNNFKKTHINDNNKFYDIFSPAVESARDDYSIREILRDSNAEAYISQDKVRVPFSEFVSMIKAHDIKELVRKQKKLKDEVIIKGELVSEIASSKQKIEEPEYIILWAFASAVFGMLAQKYLNIKGDRLFVFSLGVGFFFFLTWANKYFYDLHKFSHRFFSSNNKKDKKKKED